MADTNSSQQLSRDIRPNKCVICTLKAPMPNANFCRECYRFCMSREFREKIQYFQSQKEELLMQIRQNPETFVNKYINLLALVSYQQNS